MQQVSAPQMAPLNPRSSRLRYRMERILLTPLVRFSLRIGLPLALCLFLAAGWLAQSENRQLLQNFTEDLRDRIAARPEFQIRQFSVAGASAPLDAALHEALAPALPASSLDLDLEAIQAQAQGLDPVKSASLRILPKGVLHLEITERIPELLWRDEEGALHLLDAQGVYVGPAGARADHPDLAVIAGEAAPEGASGVLALQAALGSLQGRLRGFERVGARRWDVLLDRNQRIMLPGSGAAQALERVIAMDQAYDMFSRDILAVDMRLPRRPTLRMTQEATQEMWRIKQIEASGEVIQ